MISPCSTAALEAGLSSSASRLGRELPPGCCRKSGWACPLPVTIRSEAIDSEDISRQAEELTEKLDCLAICDELILDIVLNCAQGYFQKDKDVDSVAKDIQSRVGIYLAEQYG